MAENIKYQESAKCGALRELKAAEIFMKQGFTVSVPNMMSARYDFIAEKYPVVYRVQTETLNLKKGTVNTWYIHPFSTVKGERRIYTKKDCDVVVGICLDTGNFAIVPISEIGDKKEFRLPEHEKGRQYFNCYTAILKEKILGAVIGLCVADALGVPVEFTSRESLEYSPVTDMRGYGTYSQPPGTWSDDTSMTLCLLDSLKNGLDYADIMRKFLSWTKKGEYTPYGKVFDVGISTRRALARFARGAEPLECGGIFEHDNGNGSLMRILPLAFYLYASYGRNFAAGGEAFQIIHDTSSLTHAHQRSHIACGIYLSVAVSLFEAPDLAGGIYSGIRDAKKHYENSGGYTGELKHYNRIFGGDFMDLPGETIKSGGYVVETLEAALWCLLNSDSYESCVLKAVNLGEDTDTVAAVAGGLAGIYYGYEAIPEKWISQIARLDYIKGLCDM